MSVHECNGSKPLQKNCCCANKSQKIEEPSTNATTEVQSQQLKIMGASCGGCVNRIEQTLEAIPGVVGAHMNLETGIANVSGEVPVEHLITALNDLGYVAKIDN